MMTDDEIRSEIGSKADRVTITGDVTHKSIGIKVGEFAQATDITHMQSFEKQTEVIRKLVMDVRMMNVNVERQTREAERQRQAQQS